MSAGGQLSPGVKCDRYEIVRLIGAGAMGEVYMALHEFTKKAVALKVLKVTHAAMQEHMEKMRAEAMVLCRIKHDNLVEVYDAGIAEVNVGGQNAPVVWMAMELLEGESLRERLAREGAVRPGLALRWAAAVAEGLQATHDENVIHRDLKPENIFLTKSGKIRVLDFGTAMFEGFGQHSPADGEGTIPYMSPEQLGNEPLAGRSDIYALGYIVYEMLAGRHPFSNPDGGFPGAQQLINMHIAGDPESLEGHVGGEVWAVVARAIAKDRNQRYPTMRDMAAALQALAVRYGETSGALRLSGSSTQNTAVPNVVANTGSGVTPAPMAHTPPPAPQSGLTGGALAGLAVASLVAGAALVFGLSTPTADADPAPVDVSPAGPTETPADDEQTAGDTDRAADKGSDGGPEKNAAGDGGGSSANESADDKSAGDAAKDGGDEGDRAADAGDGKAPAPVTPRPSPAVRPRPVTKKKAAPPPPPPNGEVF